MNVSIANEVAGAFRVVAHGGKRGTVDFMRELGYKDGWMPNLILDSGITAFLTETEQTDGSQYGYIQLGTNNTPATVSQTGLLSWAKGKGNASKQTGKTKGYDSVGGYGWTRSTVQFLPGEATGTWAEIGAAPVANGNCFSRALITDVGGSATEITVLADEYLTCIYELRRWYVVPTSHNLTYYTDGVPSVVTVSYATPQYLAQAGAPQNAATRFLEGSLAYGTITGTKRKCTLTWAPNQGNPGISSLKSFSASLYDFIPVDSFATFSPAITKTLEYKVTIEFEIELKRRA